MRKFIIGRTYNDFLKYLEDHPDTNVIEMDTVVGPEPGKALLTFLFRNCNLMIAFLIDNLTSQSVINVFHFLLILHYQQLQNNKSSS